MTNVITRNLLEACGLANIPAPVSHNDLARTYAVLEAKGIDHNMTDSRDYGALVAEGRAWLEQAPDCFRID